MLKRTEKEENLRKKSSDRIIHNFNLMVKYTKPYILIIIIMQHTRPLYEQIEVIAKSKYARHYCGMRHD